ncbi:MAG: DUF1802 family protein [Chthoniobacterales bacterium]
MQSVGFKEWAIVCEALGRGEQSIILRKGGIAEGRAGFSFQEREFFLFPTFFHEQLEKTRSSGATIPERRAGEIALQFFATVEFSAVVTDWETAHALEPFHILQPAVVQERFEYAEAPGIHLAVLRVYRLMPEWISADAPQYGGCRSWVKLPEPPAGMKRKPVMADQAHAHLVEEIRALLAAPVTAR